MIENNDKTQEIVLKNTGNIIKKQIDFKDKVIEYIFKGYTPTKIADKLGISISEVYDILQNPLFHETLQNIISAMLPSVEQQVIQTTSELISNIKQELLNNPDIGIRDKIKASDSLFNMFNKLIDMTVKLKEINAKRIVPEENTMDKLIKLVQVVKSDDGEVVDGTADIIDDTDIISNDEVE